MDIPLEAFGLADPVWYETPMRWARTSSAFTVTDRAAPPDWQRHEHDPWVMLTPPGGVTPDQGWKVHVSACPDNADRVLTTVWDYCTGHGLPFKFLATRNLLRAYTLKYAPRASSGKLVAIYPPDHDALRTLCETLGAALEGEPAPYVLTDVRWGDGPLYLRYGGFLPRWCADEEGRRVLAIARPDGTLVPDRRDPVFHVPDWVEIPEFLAPHLAAREASDETLPYEVTEAIHFSNGGGVYEARAADGGPVVLKEARPHAGIDGRGSDAVARLRREQHALERLAGVDGVPALHEAFRIWEHEFLALERVEGETLQTWMVMHYPLITAEPGDELLAEYRQRACAIADRVERVLDAIHARGLVYGDLHPSNVLVAEDDTVTFVDFELTSEASDEEVATLGHPGFITGSKRGVARDRYALAVLRLWLFWPTVALLDLERSKALRALGWAAERFDLPGDYVASVHAELADVVEEGARPAERTAAGPGAAPEVGGALDCGRLDDHVVDRDAVRRSLAAGILRSATPERDDRLYPGDASQFVASAAGIAHGAAGVLWALHRALDLRVPEHEEWLLQAARQGKERRPGLYDGLHGVAFVLDELGRTADALEVLDRAPDPAEGDASLWSGLAGAGLVWLPFHRRTGEARWRQRAEQATEQLAGLLDDDTPAATDPGLFRGWSGVALLLLRAYETWAHPSLLAAAVRAVHLDLDHTTVGKDGSLQLELGPRHMPYVDDGSAGIGLVADLLHRHRPDTRLAEALPLIARACLPEVVLEAQMLSGRAGLLATVARLGRHLDPALADEAVARHVRRLDWHAVAYHGHLAFAGRHLRKLSMDLATGSAGVLLALEAAHDPRTAFLPFMGGADHTDSRRDAEGGEADARP